MNRLKIILVFVVGISASRVLVGNDAGVTFIGPSNYIPRLDLPQNIPLHSADSCKDCHQEIYDQWRESMHSKSSTNPVFQACWTVRNNPPFCSNCHFPMLEQKPKILRGFMLIKEGVTCVVCHLRNKTLYGPREIKEGEAPHPVRYDPSFQKSEFCYTCHSWGFPRARIKQTCSTSDEYKMSERKETCQDCHMSKKEGFASLGRPKHIYGMHDQKSSRNPEELRQALKVELKTERDTYKPGDKLKAEIRITNTGAGHRVPTG
ncbi:MAG: hypothetical protein HW406_1858 [Candidatus Brocadiaceae bacterium]|nr:hypothetical protein [Candidatus Brocadiaceae bacterium]